MQRRPNRPSSRRGQSRPPSSRRAQTPPDVPQVPKVPQVPSVPASPGHDDEHDLEQRRTHKLRRAPSNPLLTTRKQSRRNAGIALTISGVSIILAVALVVMLSDSKPSENTFVPIEDRPAEKLEASILSRATNAAMQTVKDAIAGNKRLKGRGIELETPSDLSATLSEMAAMTKRNGSNAGYYCYNEHEGNAGSPQTTHYVVLRSPLPNSENNATHDLEFMIIRTYSSENEMKGAMQNLRASCSKTKLVPLGRYSFSQHSQNMNADAYQAISTVSRAFVRGFNGIVPPPGTK